MIVDISIRSALVEAGSIILAMLLLPITTVADVYRWVDEKGNVHYSDQPREGASEVELTPPPTQSDTNADLAQRRENKRWFAEQRRRREQLEAEEKSQQQQRLAARKRQLRICKKSKHKLTDKQAELSARKRAGIKPKTENLLKIKIDQLRTQVERDC
ncbi:MAG: DUF4124 domain-containing protein [Exilibacterium sp.]